MLNIDLVNVKYLLVCTFPEIAISVETDSLETSYAILCDTISENFRLKGYAIRAPLARRKFVLVLFYIAPLLLFRPSRRRTVELRICQPFAVNVKFRATREVLRYSWKPIQNTSRGHVSAFTLLPAEHKNLYHGIRNTDGWIHPCRNGTLPHK